MVYLCLKNVYSYDATRIFFTEGKKYKKSSYKGNFFKLYLMDDENETCGINEHEFMITYNFMPAAWNRLKAMYL